MAEEEINCQKPCQRSLECGHPCTELCCMPFCKCTVCDSRTKPRPASRDVSENVKMAVSAQETEKARHLSQRLTKYKGHESDSQREVPMTSRHGGPSKHGPPVRSGTSYANVAARARTSAEHSGPGHPIFPYSSPLTHEREVRGVEAYSRFAAGGAARNDAEHRQRARGQYDRDVEALKEERRMQSLPTASASAIRLPFRPGIRKAQSFIYSPALSSEDESGPSHAAVAEANPEEAGGGQPSASRAGTAHATVSPDTSKKDEEDEEDLISFD
jgi:hypothetical protein